MSGHASLCELLTRALHSQCPPSGVECRWLADENGDPACLDEHTAHIARDLADALGQWTSEGDRNARAYGWEIGHGMDLVDKLVASDANPFLRKDWRLLAGLSLDWDSPTWGQAGHNVHHATTDDLGDHGRHSDETEEQ